MSSTKPLYSHQSNGLSPGAEVVVLGAGPAGLAAGHQLVSRGVHVTTLELADHVGGLCRTTDYKGFKFDLGGHRWFTKNPELHQWFLNLMEGELVTVKRLSHIVFDGKYYAYPISIKNVLRNTGILASSEAFLSYLVAATRNLASPREPENLKEAFQAQFGAKLFEMFFRRYSEKVWGSPCEEISADWAGQRSKGLSVLSALRDAIVKRKDVTSLVDEFVYPRDGYQRIPERMAEDMERGGCPVSVSSPVKRIEYEGPGRFKVFHDSPEGTREISANRVISTIPIPHLIRLMRPECDESVLQAAKSLRFRDLITVTVMVNKEHITRDTWLYVHDSNLIFARIHEPKNWSPAMVPRPEWSSVVCEIFCWKDGADWALSDEELSERVIGDLSDKLGFIQRGEVIDTHVTRTPFAYPVYDLDYKAKLEVLRAFIDQHEGLHIVGRGGTFRYNNADHSIEMGLLVARNLLGEAADPMAVNTEQAYHEEIRGSKAGTRSREDLGRRSVPASGHGD